MRYYSDGLFLIKLIKDRIKEHKNIYGKLNLDTRDRFGQNALYWAISYQKIEDIKLFLKNGISTEVAPDLDALTHAINIGNPKIVELFDRECDMALSA
ncbi:MAG: ankyrin repeat domain-containing protein [Epsilonproteobacteria bacterium]|nr:ankyrin repeat domain-containing protein [Campylobacterota bacterium]